MADVGYIRVSSVDQNTARQLDGLKLDKVFTDKVSGKDIQRPALQACLDYVREGDVLHVHSIDRLARSLSDLLRLVDGLLQKGVTVSFHKEALTFAPDTGADPVAKLQLSLLGACAEFERGIIRERQREGIEKARAAGKYRGRKTRATKGLADRARELLKSEPDKRKVARALNVSRATVYNALKAFPADGS